MSEQRKREMSEATSYSTLVLTAGWFWTIHNGDRHGPYQTQDEAKAAARAALGPARTLSHEEVKTR